MATRAPKKKPAARKAAPQRSSATGRKLINQMTANTIFRPRDVPPVYRLMTDEARVSERGVRWGWRQWITLLPRLEKHIKTRGREGLAGAMDSAQQKLLPKALHRSRDSLTVGASPSANLDVIALVAFLGAMRRKVDYDAVLASDPAAAAVVAPNPQHVQAFEQHVQRLRQDGAGAAIAAQPASTPAPAAIAALAPDLQAALQLPIGVFLPALRAVFVDAIAQAFRPVVLQQLVRDAVAEVVGGAPAAAPSTADAKGDAPPQEGDRSRDDAPALPVAAPAGDVEPASREMNGHSDNEGDTPHDLKHQIAKAMGIPMPEDAASPAPLPPPYQAHRYADEAQDSAPRHSVIVVGAAAGVQREVAKLCGAAFRFTFKRPFEFNDAKALPITTDAVLLIKKRLNKAMYQVVTRHGINVRDVSNEAAALLFALRELFPQSMPAQPIPLKRTRVPAQAGVYAH